jgi:uncharacterized membrane protein YebE (DUF533 family)
LKLTHITNCTSAFFLSYGFATYLPNQTIKAFTMFDPTQLLNALLGAGQPQASQPQSDVASPTSQGGLGGLLGSLLSNPQAAGLATMATQMFGQATSGIKDAATHAEGATGFGTKAEEALKNATGGQGFTDLLNKAKSMIGENQLASGAALGGLASLVFGTSTGRGAALDAGKLGGLAMIGGLAYKAFQNYKAANLIPTTREATVEAPVESPFGKTANAEADKQTSLTLIRAMIATAASDGLIDSVERANIVGGLSQAGLDDLSAKFLETEFNNPASIQSLVAASTSPEMAAQIYAAARISIVADKAEEIAFLQNLANGLKLDANLVAHIDAATHSVKAA